MSRSLSRERFQLASESLAELSAPLLRLMEQPFDTDKSFQDFSRLLIAPARNLHIIQKQLHGLLSASAHRQLKKLSSTMELFTGNHVDLVHYVMEDRRGGTMLCAVAADMTAQLRATLWNQDHPVILTSGTFAVGADFRRFKGETGLLADGRVTESVSASPFDYKANCLLHPGRGGIYLPGERQQILQGGRGMIKPKSGGQTVELSISGHQVRLSFAQERNPTVVQRIRVSLIDSYIRRHGTTDGKNA